MIYLATPYNHKSFIVRFYRIYKSIMIARKLISNGYNIYNPLSYSILYKQSEEYWLKHCLEMLQYCQCICVVKLNGWSKSKGIKEEMKLAKKLKLKIKYYNIYSNNKNKYKKDLTK